MHHRAQEPYQTGHTAYRPAAPVLSGTMQSGQTAPPHRGKKKVQTGASGVRVARQPGKQRMGGIRLKQNLDAPVGPVSALEPTDDAVPTKSTRQPETGAPTVAPAAQGGDRGWLSLLSSQRRLIMATGAGFIAGILMYAIFGPDEARVAPASSPSAAKETPAPVSAHPAPPGYAAGEARHYGADYGHGSSYAAQPDPYPQRSGFDDSPRRGGERYAEGTPGSAYEPTRGTHSYPAQREVGREQTWLGYGLSDFRPLDEGKGASGSARKPSSERPITRPPGFGQVTEPRTRVDPWNAPETGYGGYAAPRPWGNVAAPPASTSYAPRRQWD
jgi:hypothetical protein